jgi:hypothetical protein
MLALQEQGITYALKSRSDLILSDRFLERLMDCASRPNYDRILVSNVYTRIEPFHISDIVIFSSTNNLRLWFSPEPVFYEDLFSPEIQFARVFIRSRGLPYALTLEHYLRFLRDWVDLVDFYDEGLFWFKDSCRRSRDHDRTNLIMYDRDAGPVLTRLVSVRFHRFLQNRTYGLNLLATSLLVADALKRYVVLTTPPVLRNRFFPMFRYTLDNKGAEHTKALNVKNVLPDTLPGPHDVAAMPSGQAEARSQVPQNNQAAGVR